MDQFASAMGKQDYAISLKCDTLDYELVPLILGDYKLIIANTNKQRGLADSKYNERRSECEKAVEYLSKISTFPKFQTLEKFGSLRYLCELDYETFYNNKTLIPDATILKELDM